MARLNGSRGGKYSPISSITRRIIADRPMRFSRFWVSQSLIHWICSSCSASSPSPELTGPVVHSEIHRGGAETLGVYIRERLSEVPPMAVEVLCIVLTLTIHVIRRLREDPGTRPSRSLAVTQHVLDTYLHNDRLVGSDVALADRKAALSGAHLNSVIGDAQSNGETESLAEPIRCHARIGVLENGDKRARRNGSVGAHEGLRRNAALRLPPRVGIGACPDTRAVSGVAAGLHKHLARVREAPLRIVRFRNATQVP